MTAGFTHATMPAMSPPSAEIVHLHNHSEYSLTDGAIRLKDLVGKAKELGHTAVALTDHCNLFGAVEFYQLALKEGIKPIIGAEIYCEPSALTAKLPKSLRPEGDRAFFNLVLLAKNNPGYHNLVKNVSSGYLDGAHPDIPVVKQEKLERHAADQFCILSCSGSEFAYLVAKLRQLIGSKGEIKQQHAKTHAIWQVLQAHVRHLQNIFGSDSVYVELTDNNLPSQKTLLPDLADVASVLSLPLVASANAHYLDEKDAYAHTALISIKNDLKLSKLRHRRKNARAHMFSNDEMQKYYKNWPEALGNTAKIAAVCDVSFEFGKYHLPNFDLDSGESADAALRRLSHEGLEKRFKKLNKLYGPSFDNAARADYRKRLDYELGVIISMGFPGYFLIVQDFINWAKEQGIPVGPGRGSGAGSLVAYSLRITDLDPIPYNLIFERFLNPDRVSMPDFDVDFCQDRRDEVIAYVSRRYGKENVAQITTFGKMLAKAVVRDVGRVLDISYGKVDRIAKLIPNELGIQLKDALEREPKLKEEAARDSFIEDLLNLALQLEGLSRHTSVHAAGIVISDKPMDHYVPVYRDDAGSLITQFEMKNAEKVGLVKFDFLGLKTLTVINKAEHIIRASKAPDFDINEISLEDPKVFQLVSTGMSTGVFQLESSGMQKLLTKLQPNKFEDIIALVALFRPGPLQSGMVDDFVERKHGRQEIEYQLPQLEPILKDTYGIILYQEQVQKIAAVLANYSLGEADLLRRAMGKKKPEEMEKQKNRFAQGCADNQVDEKTATEIFDLMAKFAEYGFNKSHSAAYGLVSYQTAYLKTHFPDEYMAAIMTCDLDNSDKLVRYIQDCGRFRIQVLPPDINHSSLEFTVEGAGKVRYGLAAIKGIGAASLGAMVHDRQQNGPFRSLSDLATRVNLHSAGKKTLELMTLAGAMDVFAIERAKLLPAIGEIVKFSDNHHSAKAVGQGMLFAEAADDTGTDDTPDQFARLQEAPTTAKNKKNFNRVNHWLLEEKRLLGTYLSGHPLDLFRQDCKTFGNVKLAELPKYIGKTDLRAVCVLSDAFERPTRDGKKMMILRLEDEKEQLAIPMFNGEITLDDLPKPDTPVVCLFKVQKSFDDGPPRIRLLEIQTLEVYRKKRVRHVIFDLPAELSEPNDVENRHQDLYQSLHVACKERPGATKANLQLNFPSVKLAVKTKGLQVDLSDDFIQAVANLASGDDKVTLRY